MLALKDMNEVISAKRRGISFELAKTATNPKSQAQTLKNSRS